MDDGSLMRIKCAMIIYALERALGRYVREHGQSLENEATAQDILKRAKPPEPTVKRDDVAQVIVENSYLGEIWTLAHAAARDSSDSAHLSALDRLANSLNLFEMRNGVSHPNRPFPDCYWYRCGAIAADPSTDALGFYEVSLALQNALEGKLEEPPETWLYKKRWVVPTALPSEFEHSITGLIGRQKDTAKLLKELRNQRSPLIALVARGGIGKTSLLLQVVSDFCLSPEAPQFFDAVLWASFKQERLSSAGIELLSAPQGLDELEIALCLEATELFGVEVRSFEEMKSQFGEKRLLLCLDNLETLLRDSSRNFEVFYDDLPHAWKVAVTSRIPVDNAKNVPLDVLDRAGSVGFARAYLGSRGVMAPDQALIEKICAGSGDNPLAIRLAIELYLAGAELDTALQKSEQELLSFSFTNLLDRLSSVENDLLEAVFVMEQPSRSDLCSALDISADVASQAISKLSKMSLVVRQEEPDSRETYVLGASIRDLLRSHPRNLQLRSRIVSWVSKSRTVAQELMRQQAETNLSRVELSYFPASAHPSLISTCKQIKAAVRRDDRSALVAIEIDVRHKLESQPSPLLHRLFAWVAFELNDYATAVTHFQKASAIDKTDPAPLFGLALTLQAQGNWSDLSLVTEGLIDDGWGETDQGGQYYANRIWALHLQALNIQERQDDVLKLTDDWPDRIDRLPSLAIGRASAYRRIANARFRSHQVFSHKDLLELGELLAKACRLMTKVLIQEGFLKWYLHELRKIVSELQYHAGRGADLAQFNADDRDTIQTLLRLALSNEASRAGVPDSDIRDLLYTAFESRGEPRQSILLDVKDLLAEGYTLGKVKAGARPEAKYFFVQDDKGKDYFVRFDVFEGGDPSRRALLRPDATVALKYDPTETGNAYRAVDAWLVRFSS